MAVIWRMDACKVWALLSEDWLPNHPRSFQHMALMRNRATKLLLTLQQLPVVERHIYTNVATITQNKNSPLEAIRKLQKGF